MSDEEAPVVVEMAHGDSVCTIRLNRPSSLNSLSKRLVADLAEAFRRVSANKNVKAVILTGTGRAFSAGVDLTDPPDAVRQSLDDPQSLMGNPVYQMSKCPVPIIGAINGFCITGAFELALNCDIIIASTNASFKDTHVTFGLAPCWGLSQRLQRLVGAGRAQLLSYTARKLSAKDAYDWGLVAAVVPPEDLHKAAEGIALEIAENDAAMVRAYKSTLNTGMNMAMGEALTEERRRAVVHYKGMDLGGGIPSWRSKL